MGCVCVHVSKEYVFEHVNAVPTNATEGIRSLRAGVIGGCKHTNIGAVN